MLYIGLSDHSIHIDNTTVWSIVQFELEIAVIKMFSHELQVEELQEKVIQTEKQSSKKVKQLQDLLRFAITGVCVMLYIQGGPKIGTIFWIP